MEDVNDTQSLIIHTMITFGNIVQILHSCQYKLIVKGNWSTSKIGGALNPILFAFSHNPLTVSTITSQYVTLIAKTKIKAA